MKKLLSTIPYLLVAILVGVTVTYAGSLTPPGPAANTMYSLTDIFNLSTGTTSTLGVGAIPATPGTVAATGKTLTEVYDAIAGEIAAINPATVLTGTTIFGVSGSASSGGLPKTGQTLCYDSVGATIACAGTGQDGEFQVGLPTSGARFTDNGDGTISDNATGLMWKKCSEGLSGATCATGAATAPDWATALSTCNADSTATLTDWRLPNMRELLSIYDYDVHAEPAIDSTFFPATPADSYWSSTSYSNNGLNEQKYAIGLYFKWGGYTDYFDKALSTLRVRCVR